MLSQIGSSYNAAISEIVSQNYVWEQILKFLTEITNIEFSLSVLLGFYNYQKFIDGILDFFFFNPFEQPSLIDKFLCVIEMVNGNEKFNAMSETRILNDN